MVGRTIFTIINRNGERATTKGILPFGNAIRPRSEDLSRARRCIVTEGKAVKYLDVAVSIGPKRRPNFSDHHFGCPMAK